MSIRRGKTAGAEKMKLRAPTPARRDKILIGTKLKHARLAMRMTLRELAGKLNCSESFLSKVEHDRVRPSLSMLHRIVGHLGINVAALFAETGDVPPVLVIKSGERPLIMTDPMRSGPGIVLERLVAVTKGVLIEASIHRIAAGGHTDGFISHAGEEIGYVLEGALELLVDGSTYRLTEGDCFFFRSDLQHGYRNTGNGPTRVLWVNTPPTF